MDELKIAKPRESAITSQLLDAEHRADPKITGNNELVGAGMEPNLLKILYGPLCQV